jgi:uncharacterized protein YjiS (DUF1127 family)
MRRMRIMAGVRRATVTMGVWYERRRGRVELTRMNPYELRDIGISRGDALFEAGKPFWRS